MERAYRKRLQELATHQTEAVISRRGATELRGKVMEVNDDGVIIHTEDATIPKATRLEGGGVQYFVDFSDICGIGTFDWDLSGQ